MRRKMKFSVMFSDEKGTKKYKNVKNDVFFDVFVNKNGKT